MWSFTSTEASKAKVDEKNFIVTKHPLVNNVNTDYVLIGCDSYSCTSPSKSIFAEAEYRLAQQLETRIFLTRLLTDVEVCG